MLQIALPDEHELVVRGVASMLRHSGDQCELVDLGGPLSRPIDIALYDTLGLSQNSLHGFARLVADRRIRKVVVYTWNFQPWVAEDVVEQGAAGYLSKRLGGDQLVRALLEIHKDQIVVSPVSNSSRVGGEDWLGREEGLTPREAEVLSLIALGLSNVELSQRLGVSINSIKSYIRTCYRKIDVSSRTRAVLWAVDHDVRKGPLPGSGSAVGLVDART